MLKKITLILFLAFLIAASARAQVGTTPIQDTIYDQYGNRYTGPLVISLSNLSATSLGSMVLSIVKTIQITNGALSTSLVPNDTALPVGTQYVFQFGNVSKQTCTIPTSSTPLTLASYCTQNAPATPSPIIPLTWLASGTLAGQSACWTGSAWVAGSCAGYGVVLYSALPTCNSSTVLSRGAISDATLATPGSTAAGGGTVKIGVECIYTGLVYRWIID